MALEPFTKVNKKIHSIYFYCEIHLYYLLFTAYDIITKKNVALKEENLFSGYDQLISERELYFKLGEQIGFLEVFDFFSTSKYRYLAFTLVDKCLESKINEIGKKLNLKSTLQVARQLVCLINISFVYFIHCV